MITIKPLNKDTWNDFLTLFGENGACAGCWCMWWRLRKKDWDANKGDGNRDLIKKLVDEGVVPGLIGYLKNEPVAWISVGPRSDFIRFETSKVMKSVDDMPVWSIVCFFIDKKYRRKGLNQPMIEAAVDFAIKNGAPAVEAYPTDLAGAKKEAPFIYTGVASTFSKAGFVEVARRSAKRPIMRKNKS